MLTKRVFDFLDDVLIRNPPKKAANGASARVQVEPDGTSWVTISEGPTAAVIEEVRARLLTIPPSKSIRLRVTWYVGDTPSGEVCCTKQLSLAAAEEAPAQIPRGDALVSQAVDQSLRAARVLADYGERALLRVEAAYDREDALRERFHAHQSSEVLDAAKADAIRVAALRAGDLVSSLRVYLVTRSLPADTIGQLGAVLRSPERADVVGTLLDAVGFSEEDVNKLLGELLDWYARRAPPTPST